MCMYVQIKINSNYITHAWLVDLLKMEIKIPGKKSTTVTFILPSTTSLRMGFPIGLNSIFLRTFVTLPFLLTVLPAKMLLDAS